MPTGGSAGPLLRQAMAHHRARRLREALQCYQQALLLAPEDADALTYSAAALLDLQKPAEAVRRLQAALAVRPRHAESLGYLGTALQLSGEQEAAEKACREAVALAPQSARLLNNLGVVLAAGRRREEAAGCFEAALAIDPAYGEGANNLSKVCLKLGQPERALPAVERAIRQSPGAAYLHNALGNALGDAGRSHEAVAAYREALRLRPGWHEAASNLAIALVAAGEAAEALAVTDRLLAPSPGDVTELATRSVALNELGESEAFAKLVDSDRLLQRFTVAPGPAFDSLAAFNAALAQHVRAHPTLRFAPDDHATRNGLHSGDLLREPRGPIAQLQRCIAESCARYLAALPAGYEHPFLARRPERWELDIWAVVMQRQGHQVAHIHPSAWLSGVYYVQVSDAVADGSHQGWIEFGRPQTIYRAKAEPRVTLLRPVEGEMLLFPSFFFHRTIAFDAPAERICIAFDLCPPGQRGYAS